VARSSAAATKRAQTFEREPQQQNEVSRRESLEMHDRIAVRAFEMFEQRGGRHGLDLEDWFRAERKF